jgi:hypothetical protein
VALDHAQNGDHGGNKPAAYPHQKFSGRIFPESDAWDQRGRSISPIFSLLD